MGFCIFSNIAIAAHYARARHGAERVAYVDVDVHHGDGVEYAFREDPDVLTISFHETNEWDPTVLADGRIVYTRWDYVDRDTNVAHHIWSCFPDGRDPRAYHGNYPTRREARPASAAGGESRARSGCRRGGP